MQREVYVKTEAEMGVTRPQAKECLEPPETRKGEEEFSRVFRWSTSLLTPWFRTSGLQTVTQYICVVFTIQFMVICYGISWKLIHTCILPTAFTPGRSLWLDTELWRPQPVDSSAVFAGTPARAQGPKGNWWSTPIRDLVASPLPACDFSISPWMKARESQRKAWSSGFSFYKGGSHT